MITASNVKYGTQIKWKYFKLCKNDISKFLNSYVSFWKLFDNGIFIKFLQIFFQTYIHTKKTALLSDDLTICII